MSAQVSCAGPPSLPSSGRITRVAAPNDQSFRGAGPRGTWEPRRTCTLPQRSGDVGVPRGWKSLVRSAVSSVGGRGGGRTCRTSALAGREGQRGRTGDCPCWRELIGLDVGREIGGLSELRLCFSGAQDTSFPWFGWGEGGVPMAADGVVFTCWRPWVPGDCRERGCTL